MLTAAYIGRITDELLHPRLPETKPAGLELKKLVFAAYNTGAGTIVKAATLAAKKKRDYTWDDVKSELTRTGIAGGKIEEVTNYVANITKRLS